MAEAEEMYPVSNPEFLNESLYFGYLCPSPDKGQVCSRMTRTGKGQYCIPMTLICCEFSNYQEKRLVRLESQLGAHSFHLSLLNLPW